MSRMHRIRRRRASHSTAAHLRARTLTAQRIDEALAPADASWLNEHLDGCESCRAVAAAYEADRLALRSLRDYQPEPPRDLWARTSAALERESKGRTAASRRATGPLRSGPALGLLSGVAVIAVVIGASVLSGGFIKQPTTAVGPVASTPAIAVVPTGNPNPTPIVVGPGAVGWVGMSPDGRFAYNVTRVHEVCATNRQPDCATAGGDSKAVAISIKPKSISESGVRNQAVVVGTDAKGNDSVLVIALPSTGPSATPTPTATSEPTATPTPVVTPSQTVSPPPTPTPTPTASVAETPSATPPIAPSETPEVTPEPTVAATLAIVSGVRVVGQSAAYSPDWAWFAFTARPSDDSAGPDIYVWHVGDPLARAVTTDHASVFASWAGNQILGSRPTATADATAEVEARSFFLDPVTGTETPIAAPVWRPIVDPAGDRAVTWAGTVKLGADGLTTVPATGQLVLRPFTAGIGPNTTGDAAPVVADGPISVFDVRWDETGQWLAVWVADSVDPTIGRLSLMRVDPTTGQLAHPDGAPQDVTALPGFSIKNGRLAWATPPGQGGEGSRVQIVAWTDQAVGAVESAPADDIVVVH
jgi:hypothetical protein